MLKNHRFLFEKLVKRDFWMQSTATLKECAENLGSGKLRRMLTVTVPVVMPSIAAGALMVFMTALADFGTPGILAGGNFRTLPVLIYNEYLSETGGNANLASAISMIIVVISLLILFLQKWWVARKNYQMSALRPPAITEYHGAKRFLITLPVAIVTLISFLPQAVVVFCSFVKTNYSNFVFSEGFTFEHYAELGRNLTTNIRNSFVFSTVAIVFILILGILMSYVIVRRRGKTGGALDMLMMAPYVIPGSVLGLCYIVAFNNLGRTADGTVIRLTGTASIIIISMIIRKMPYTVRSGSAFLMQMDPSIEEASINLGVSPMKTFAKVTVRMMLPGVLSGAIISWVTCINELSTSIMALYRQDSDHHRGQLYGNRPKFSRHRCCACLHSHADQRSAPAHLLQSQQGQGIHRLIARTYEKAVALATVFSDFKLLSLSPADGPISRQVTLKRVDPSVKGAKISKVCYESCGIDFCAVGQ